MQDVREFSEINEVKADMGHIYDRPDPRQYYRELQDLGYVIPGKALPIFNELLGELGRKRGGVKVLDIGCSYGVNAALLRHDVTMDDLYERWTDRTLDDVGRDEVISSDRRYFEARRNDEDLTVVGLDPAASAISYAEDVGLLEDGFALDLEAQPLPPGAADAFADVDLVTSTGCVGYVTEKSFERILPAVSQGAWLANFVLRLFPFDAIAGALGARGHVTEKLHGRRFVQRRFASAEEQRDVIGQLVKRGVEPVREELDGYMVAEFFLSRPAAEVAEKPIGDLLLA